MVIRGACLAVVAAALCVVCGPFAAVRAQPAGSTAAVLSFIDAAAGRVEVVRHWPGAPVDVDVYPFTPYFWDSCPGRGAIMMLVTAPAPPADATFLAGRLRTALRAAGSDAAEIRQLAASARTPGDPFLEAATTMWPVVAGLDTYERRGYAVFAFIMWQGWRCGVTLRAVPEGYAIPFVR